jgi:site-specific DNA-methyltransferase (adenine-specific)
MPDVTLHRGDCLEVLATLPADAVDAVVTDPPYGMDWDTDTTRFSGGVYGDGRRGQGDAQPFDPVSWLRFPKVILWGANHYAARLPVGTTLVWIKKADHLFGTFLSDAEIGWMKGGYGVYCFRKQFPPPCRMAENGGTVAHPNQKPIALMRWCLERLRLEPGATVLDPYMGSGTTGIACLDCGYNFIGIESDPTHFARAERRIARAERPLLNGIA